MNKLDLRVVFALATSMMVVGVFVEPSLFGDENLFLAGFVNHEFLSFMGIIVSITLASTVSLHMALTRKEDEKGQCFLSGTKAAVRKSAFSLIWALIAAIFLVVTKAALPEVHPWDGLCNVAALAIILFGIFVMYDITKLAFRL